MWLAIGSMDRLRGTYTYFEFEIFLGRHYSSSLQVARVDEATGGWKCISNLLTHVNGKNHRLKQNWSLPLYTSISLQSASFYVNQSSTKPARCVRSRPFCCSPCPPSQSRPQTSPVTRPILPIGRHVLYASLIHSSLTRILKPQLKQNLASSKTASPSASDLQSLATVSRT